MHTEQYSAHSSEIQHGIKVSHLLHLILILVINQGSGTEHLQLTG